jgi:DNA-binding PadR family transcriptional regulator
MSPGEMLGCHNLNNPIVKQKFMAFLLWMFSKEEMHGYQLMKKLKEDKGLPSIPASRIYPMLSDMCEEGYLKCRVEKEGKREKKVYRTTPKGKKILIHIKKHLKKSKLLQEYINFITGDVE